MKHRDGAKNGISEVISSFLAKFACVVTPAYCNIWRKIASGQEITTDIVCCVLSSVTQHR